MISRSQLQNETLSQHQKRTIVLYQQQLESLTTSEMVPKDFGVKKNSILNSSKYFNICSNQVFDIMHNLLEGIVRAVPMEIKLVLNYYINAKSIFQWITLMIQLIFLNTDLLIGRTSLVQTLKGTASQ